MSAGYYAYQMKRKYLHKIVVLLVSLIGAALLSVTLSACSKQAPPAEKESLPTNINEPAHLDPAYILLIGDDSWEKYTPGHADLMMLRRLDFDKHAITLVSVPRDTKTKAPDGTYTKLNQIYTLAGPEAQCAAVSSVVGVDVKQYVTLGFNGLQDIVKHVGDLPINLPYALQYSFYTHDYPNENFPAGEQTLTPWRAMALSRSRTNYKDYGLEPDMMRQVVDRQMMTNLIKIVFSDPSKTGELLETLQDTISTNIPLKTQTDWAKHMGTGKQITVYSTSGPYAGSLDAQTGLWLVTPDPDHWNQLMKAVKAGDDPAPAAAAYANKDQSPLAPLSATTVIDLP